MLKNIRKYVVVATFALIIGVCVGCLSRGDKSGAFLALSTAIPATAVAKGKKEGGVAPIFDTSGMSKAQLEAKLQELYAQANSNQGGVFSIRFNDGSEATHYEAGEKLRDANGRLTDKVAVGGEVKSARDSGTLSVYGFGRNPVTLYAGQWLDLLATRSHAILSVINEKADSIDAYISRKTGNTKQTLNRELITSALARFQPATLVVTEENVDDVQKALEVWLESSSETEGEAVEATGTEG